MPSQSNAINPNGQSFSVVKLIPITALIACLSQFSILTYYYLFNFAPMPYFDSYEIIVASLKDFVIVGIVVILYFQMVIIYVVRLSRWQDYLKLKRLRKIPPTGRPSSSRRNKKDSEEPWMRKILLLFCGIIMIIVIVIWNFYPKKIDAIVVLLATIAFLLLTANSFTFKYSQTIKKHTRALRQYYPNIDHMIVLSAMILISFIALMSLNKARFVKENNPYIGTTLTLDTKESIKITSKVLLIGKSKDYYFIFNKPDSSIRVLKRSQIIKESLKYSSDPKASFYRF